MNTKMDVGTNAVAGPRPEHRFFAADLAIEIATALAYGQRAGFRGDSEIISRTFGIRTSFETRLFVDEIPPEKSEREQIVQPAPPGDGRMAKDREQEYRE